MWGHSAAATILVAQGVVLLIVVATGRTTLYLRPSFQPLLAATAVVLIVLGVWTLVDLGRAATGSHSPLRAASWLAVVPVALALLAAPAPLGSWVLGSPAVSDGGGAPLVRGPQQAPTWPSLDPSATTEIGLDELVDRYQIGLKAQLEGRSVKVLGMASPRPGGGWSLGRFKIYCCAADALAYQVDLEGLGQELVADQWYQVTGTVRTSSDSQEPVLEVTTLQAVPQPESPYL